MKYYENPDCVPLEELKLNVKSDGVVVNALDTKWMDVRYLLHYEEPDIYCDDGSEIVGAKEHWLEVVGYIIEDLDWLLNLPFYRFWSNIVYNPSIIDTLVSFLQEAPPFYALEIFPSIPEMLEALEKLCRNVLMVFARLVTNKESPAEYMSRPFLGNLLYDNYIFTIPIIFDLCQLYGRENAKIVEKIVHSVFSLQPLYNDDLQKSVPCLIKALGNVEQRFESFPVNVTEAVVLSDREGSLSEMTLYNIEDLILYTLDVSSTITILLRNYSMIISIFYREDFLNKILSVYGNTIPEMYKKLDKLGYNDGSMPKYIELKHRLDVTRMEILNLYRIIIYEPILTIQKKIDAVTESEIRSCVDKYFNSLMNATSEKEFIMDYHQLYPINLDFEVISKFFPEVDTIKCEYILNLLYASIGETEKAPTNAYLNNIIMPVPGPSSVQNNRQQELYVNCVNNQVKSISRDLDKPMSLVSVKEIFSDYGEGFIQLCLKHYNYDCTSVINAILENNLPPNLNELDRTLPYIPPDPMEPSTAVDSAIGIQRLNVFDNDEFDIITGDVIDRSRIYKGKKREKYKDVNEMLNDKSEIKYSRDIYEKYSVTVDYVDDYNDEYDDTYDSHNIRSNAADDSTEVGARTFTVPRVFRVNDKNDISSEDDTDIEDGKLMQNNDYFVQDPAELRAKKEQQRQSAKGGKNAHNIRKPSGQEEDKDVSTRHKKNVHKASQKNHNRRMGSQMKRKQGMIPS